MGQTLANFDKVLKLDYLGPIRDQINNTTILMKRLEKNEEDVGGKEAIVPLHVGRNVTGARADGGTLPSAGQQAYENAKYKCAYNYARIEVTGPTIKAARKNKYAFVRAVDSEIKGATKDMRDDINRQLHGNGTGVLCLVNGDPGTGTTLTVDTPGAMYLQKGMVIDIVDPASTTAGDGRANSKGLVIASKASLTQATVTAAFHDEVVDNDFVVRGGNYLLEMMGIGGIVSASNPGALQVGGINRSTAGNEWWKANVLANSGTARKLTQVA